MRKWILVVSMVSGLVAGEVSANGYKILGVKSAKATAMGEAFIVQADDPSAVAINPAGISQLQSNQVQAQVTVCNAYASRTSPTGEKSHNEDQWQPVPSFFATTELKKDVTAGLGLSFPNGLSSTWADDSFVRYVATYSDLVVADLSPAIGAKVTDHLRLGVAADYYYSQAKLEHMMDVGMLHGAPGKMDTKSTMEGSGSAWGYNVGAIYEFNREHAVALTYRAPYTINYDGDLSMGGQNLDLSTAIDFPAVVVAGYAWRPTDKWKFEINLDWTDWDQTGDITLHFKNPGIPDATQKQGLQNTVAYKLGAEYLYSEKLALRAGYIYNQNATPEEDWRPSLLDTDVQFITAGFGYRLSGWTIDTALQLVFYKERTINNNVDGNETTSSSSIDGTYKAFAPCVSLAATYGF